MKEYDIPLTFVSSEEDGFLLDPYRQLLLTCIYLAFFLPFSDACSIFSFRF